MATFGWLFYSQDVMYVRERQEPKRTILRHVMYVRKEAGAEAEDSKARDVCPQRGRSLKPPASFDKKESLNPFLTIGIYT